jgi:hypothetical protein
LSCITTYEWDENKINKIKSNARKINDF